MRSRTRRAVTAGWALATWPVFSRTSYAMLSSLREQGLAVRTLLDVGANKGQFSVAARQIFKPSRIHAFEPIPALIEPLRSLSSRYPEMVVHPVACGPESKEATLHVNAHSQASSLRHIATRHLQAFPMAMEQVDVTVPVRRLDEEISVDDLDAPVLLKIDTQGYEMEVLDGADRILGKIDVIIVETSFSPMYDGERPFVVLLERLRQLGFEFVRPVGSLVDPHNGEFLQMDGMFTRVGTPSGADGGILS